MEELTTTPLVFSMQFFQNSEFSHDSHLLDLICYLHNNSTRILRILILEELQVFS